MLLKLLLMVLCWIVLECAETVGKCWRLLMLSQQPVAVYICKWWRHMRSVVCRNTLWMCAAEHKEVHMHAVCMLAHNQLHRSATLLGLCAGSAVMFGVTGLGCVGHGCHCCAALARILLCLAWDGLASLAGLLFGCSAG